MKKLKIFGMMSALALGVLGVPPTTEAMRREEGLWESPRVPLVRPGLPPLFVRTRAAPPPDPDGFCPFRWTASRDSHERGDACVGGVSGVSAPLPSLEPPREQQRRTSTSRVSSGSKLPSLRAGNRR
ncbi:MAG: hypothetical protein LBJ70_05400 [Holosporales bacterium]|nr:hypothetical protein [Holosporales bacterium]